MLIYTKLCVLMLPENLERSNNLFKTTVFKASHLRFVRN